MTAFTRSIAYIGTWSLLVFLAAMTAACGGDKQTTAPEPSPPIPEEIPSIDPSKVEPAGDVLVVTNQVTLIAEATMRASDLQDLVGTVDGRIMAKLPGLEETNRRIYQVELETSSGQEVAEIANRLTRSPGIITALERTLIPPDDHFDNDALTSPKAWAYDTVGASHAWHIIDRHADDLNPVKIGVIDTGVDSDHPEFDGRITLGQSFITDDPEQWDDEDGHGTKVAGTIVAKTDNGGMNGVIGPAGSKISTYVYRTGLVWDSGWDKFLSIIDQCESGVLDGLAIIGALMKTQADQLNVVNMSFTPSYPDSLNGAKDRAARLLTDLLSQNERLVLVAAAGNDGGSARENWPVGSQRERFILVGGTDKNDDRWKAQTACGVAESAMGGITVAAPATNVWTTERGGGYVFAHGTSLSTPLVTGAAGTLLALDVPPADVKNILISTAVSITVDTNQGLWNRLDLCRSAADALGLTEESKRIISESGNDRNQPPSDIYFVEPFECGKDRLGATIQTPSGETPVITDLALDSDSVLWGSSFDTLYRVDIDDGTAQKVGAFGVEGVNALDFAPDGSLYGAAQPTGLFGSPEPGKFLLIDTGTASATEIGEFSPDLGPAGDLEFSDNGTLFASVRDISSSTDVPNALATIDTASGEATLVDSSNSLGFSGVFGLNFSDGTLFGLTFEENNPGKLIAIDTARGTGRYVRDLGFDAFGAASRTGPSSN